MSIILKTASGEDGLCPSGWQVLAGAGSHPQGEPIAGGFGNPPRVPISKLSRRAVLRGAGVTVALPLLDAFRAARPARAASALPKRFVVMFSPNGTIYPNWVPSGTESSFTLSPILQPLAPYQSDVVVVAGLAQQGGGGDGHQNGIGGMLTGQSLNPGPFQGGANSGTSGWAAGVSIDQSIAAALGGTTQLRSLELGVQVVSADNWSRMSYLGSDHPLTPDESPLGVYTRLFAASKMSPADLLRLRARRRSVLDAVLGQFGAVSARVGVDDRARLDAHATSIREIETRLDAQAMAAPGCADPGAPALPADPTANDSYPAVGKLQMDLLALALGCDITRVASLQWSRSVSQVRFTWLGVHEGHHDLSHLPDDDTPTVTKLTAINNWYAAQFAYLVGKLAATTQVDGSRLLDSSLLLWCNELGKGNTHSRKNAPYVIAGAAGGALRTGRFLTYTGDPPHNNLLVSLQQAMGVPTTKFGKPEWCTGPLSNFL